MRILVVIEQGVSSRYFERALPVLAARGFDVQVLTLGGRGPLHEALGSQGLEAGALGLDRRAAQALAPVPLARELRRRRPDVVHAHEAVPAALAWVAAGLARVPARRAYHRHHGRTAGVHARVSRLAAARADVTVAVSAYVARCAEELDRVGPERVVVAGNGVPDPGPVPAGSAAEVRRALGVPEDAGTVTVVARLRPEKGHRWLFDSLPAAARASGRPLHCFVVGDGPERQALAAVAPSDPAVHVHFVGAVDDVGPWLAAGDVAVVPSLHEPFGLVAVEAMAYGRPLVAAATGGLTETVVDGETGVLVPVGDRDALAAALAAVLTDSGAAAAMGGAARARFVAGFTTEHMVDRWIPALVGGSWTTS